MAREWDFIRDQVAIDMQILAKKLEDGEISPAQAAGDLLDFARVLGEASGPAKMMNPRKPTEEERVQLIQYLFEQENIVKPTEEDREDKAGMIENAAIAVFDGYITDGPGYSGRVMVVVWIGGPDITETFIWREGKLEKVPIYS